MQKTTTTKTERIDYNRIISDSLLLREMDMYSEKYGDQALKEKMEYWLGTRMGAKYKIVKDQK